MVAHSGGKRPSRRFLGQMVAASLAASAAFLPHKAAAEESPTPPLVLTQENSLDASEHLGSIGSDKETDTTKEHLDASDLPDDATRGKDAIEKSATTEDPVPQSVAQEGQIDANAPLADNAESTKNAVEGKTVAEMNSDLPQEEDRSDFSKRLEGVTDNKDVVEKGAVAGNLASTAMNLTVPPVLGAVEPIVGTATTTAKDIKKGHVLHALVDVVVGVPSVAAGFFGGGLAADGVRYVTNGVLADLGDKSEQPHSDLGDLVKDVRYAAHATKSETQVASAQNKDPDLLVKVDPPFEVAVEDLPAPEGRPVFARRADGIKPSP